MRPFGAREGCDPVLSHRPPRLFGAGGGGHASRVGGGCCARSTAKCPPVGCHLGRMRGSSGSLLYLRRRLSCPVTGNFDANARDRAAIHRHEVESHADMIAANMNRVSAITGGTSLAHDRRDSPSRRTAAEESSRELGWPQRRWTASLSSSRSIYWCQRCSRPHTAGVTHAYLITARTSPGGLRGSRPPSWTTLQCGFPASIRMLIRVSPRSG